MWNPETRELALGCKTWLGIIVSTLVIGGIIGGTARRAYLWIDGQDQAVIRQDRADAIHDEALRTVGEYVEHAVETNRLGCAAGKFGRWYCNTQGLPYNTMREEDD